MQIQISGNIFYCCSVTGVPIFLHCSLLPHPPHTLKVNPHSYSCPWVTYICSLNRPFPFSPLLSPSPCPSSRCQSISCFHVSGSICSFVCFVHQVSLISKIIWYLSFANWFISLSIISPLPSMLSKRQEFFLSFCCVVFHCVNVP